MIRRNQVIVYTTAMVLLSSLGLALVGIFDEGRWPDSWPKELEPYRVQAKTIQVMTLSQSTTYEIFFKERENFEKAWPHILSLKSKGAPLILENAPSDYCGSTLQSGVWILGVANREGKSSDGKRFFAGPPWPDDIKSKSGELPEWVAFKDGKWIPVVYQDRKWVTPDGAEHLGVIYRARVDIILVVDGKIIDLNRIQLPPDTPIIDKRFKEKQNMSIDTNKE